MSAGYEAGLIARNEEVEVEARRKEFIEPGTSNRMIVKNTGGHRVIKKYPYLSQ